jgi:hypothetical protein
VPENRIAAAWTWLSGACMTVNGPLASTGLANMIPNSAGCTRDQSRNARQAAASRPVSPSPGAMRLSMNAVHSSNSAAHRLSRSVSRLA